jgi:exopolyphosphatase/guanosine-5'-triphosphate,3'-diphosphate pyrophosphatase
VPLYAAVDLGTNNCRLLVARREGETFRVIDSYSQVVRLGEGLAATGRLSEAAMERACASFVAIKRKLKNHGVAHIRCIATEACRKAENGPDFIKLARDRYGLSFKVIGAREEAKLAAIGCHDLLEPESNLVIAFMDLNALEERTLTHLVKSTPIKAWGSFPLGVVTLTESFAELGEGAAFKAMFEHALKTLGAWKAGEVYYDLMKTDCAYMIGTSGTVTCLAGVHLQLETYRRDRVDGAWMSREEMFNVIEQLDQGGRKGRLALPTVGRDRADLMMSGCAILQAACTLWPTDRLRVADRGLREGLLLSMIYGAKRRRKRGGRRRRKPDSLQAQSTVKTTQPESGAL